MGYLEATRHDGPSIDLLGIGIAAALLVSVALRWWVSVQLRQMSERASAAERSLSAAEAAIDKLGRRVAALERDAFYGRFRPTQERLHEIAERGNELLYSGVARGMLRGVKGWDELTDEESRQSSLDQHKP